MNGIFNRFQYRRLTNVASLHGNTNLRAMLLRSTGSYTFNPDHDYVADILSNGGVELSVASYARQTITNSTITLDDTNNLVMWDFDNIAFGSLESGQTVSAIVFYEFDTDDASSPLICHIDGKIKVTAAAPAIASTSGVITGMTQANPGVVACSAAHGLTTGDKVYISSVGGMVEVNSTMFTITVVSTTSFSIGVSTAGYTAYTSGGSFTVVRPVYVEPLAEALASGTAATVGAGSGTVQGAHARGDRTLFMRGLNANVALAATGTIQSTVALPAVLGGGAFNFNVNASGFMAFDASQP